MSFTRAFTIRTAVIFWDGNHANIVENRMYQSSLYICPLDTHASYILFAKISVKIQGVYVVLQKMGLKHDMSH